MNKGEFVGKFECACCQQLYDFADGYENVITFDDGTNQEFREVCKDCFVRLSGQETK
jgi:hypothetical protein